SEPPAQGTRSLDSSRVSSHKLTARSKIRRIPSRQQSRRFMLVEWQVTLQRRNSACAPSSLQTCANTSATQYVFSIRWESSHNESPSHRRIHQLISRGDIQLRSPTRRAA